MVTQALAPFVEPAILVSSTRAQRGFDLEVSYLEREHMEQLLADKFATEGIQEPSYDHVKLRDARGKWYRPGEAPDVPTPDLFPIMLYYRPPKPEQSAEMVLAMRQRKAYEGLTPTQRRGLSEVQRQLERAYSTESNDLLDRAMRLAHSLGLPLGSAGLPVSLMPESVCFPKGNEPLLYDGHLYSMQSTSMLVFDPPDFSVPMGVWNPQRQRVDPAVMQNEAAGRTDIIHFGKTFHMLEQGHVIDPDSQQVVGMIRPMNGDFEFFDPIPLPVADFMMRRGFRLEAPSARLTHGPFVQILPQVGDDDGIPELHLQMQSAGNAKALKYAPIEQRGNKDLMIQAMRQAQGPQSWKIMLCGTQEILADRDVLSEAVKQDYSAMAYASDYYSDRNFMLQAVQSHGVALQYGTEEIRSDPDLAYIAVKASWRALRNVSEKLRGSSRIVREAVKQCWQALEYASEELQDDKDVVNLAVKQTWRALQFTSGRLRGDASFVLKVASQSIDALHFATDALLNNPEFMQQAVQLDGMALRFAAEAVIDRQLVLQAVQGNWRALQYAPERLRADRAVVLEAVRQHHSALQLAAPEVLLDEELIFEAARRRPDLLRCLPDTPRSSRGLMMRMVKLHPMSLQYAADNIRGDEEIVLEALRRNWRSFQFATTELKSSQRFLLQAVQLDALVLSLADEELRKDPQIVCEAVEREWEMLQHVSEDLRGNHAFMLEAVGIEGLSLKYASEELSHDRELVVAAIGNSGQALEFAADELRRDPEIVLMATRQDFEAICYADEALTTDFGFMFRAVRVDGLALKGASIDLQADPDLVLAAVHQNWRSLSYANRSLRANLDFMLQAVGLNSFALAMAAEELWMNPQLLAAAAQEPSEESPGVEKNAPEVGVDLRRLLQQARPNWSEADLQSAEQKLSVIGVTTVPLLAQAAASDLNGRLRAAGQKIFTATTVMELKARSAASMAEAAECPPYILNRSHTECPDITEAGGLGLEGVARRWKRSFVLTSLQFAGLAALLCGDVGALLLVWRGDWRFVEHTVVALCVEMGGRHSQDDSLHDSTNSPPDSPRDHGWRKWRINKIVSRLVIALTAIFLIGLLVRGPGLGGASATKHRLKGTALLSKGLQEKNRPADASEDDVHIADDAKERPPRPSIAQADEDTVQVAEDAKENPEHSPSTAPDEDTIQVANDMPESSQERPASSSSKADEDTIQVANDMPESSQERPASSSSKADEDTVQVANNVPESTEEPSTSSSVAAPSKADAGEVAKESSQEHTFPTASTGGGSQAEVRAEANKEALQAKPDMDLAESFEKVQELPTRPPTAGTLAPIPTGGQMPMEVEAATDSGAPKAAEPVPTGGSQHAGHVTAESVLTRLAKEEPEPSTSAQADPVTAQAEPANMLANAAPETPPKETGEVAAENAAMPQTDSVAVTTSEAPSPAPLTASEAAKTHAPMAPVPEQASSASVAVEKDALSIMDAQSPSKDLGQVRAESMVRPPENTEQTEPSVGQAVETRAEIKAESPTAAETNREQAKVAVAEPQLEVSGVGSVRSDASEVKLSHDLPLQEVADVHVESEDVQLTDDAQSSTSLAAVSDGTLLEKAEGAVMRAEAGLQQAEKDLAQTGGQVLEQVQKVAAAGQEMLQGVEEEGSAVAREVQKAVAESGEMLSSEVAKVASLASPK
ncbi:unnamed protein product [Symbiodinium pilosum]|uniref:DUF4116 domain-containing protein n=1 Tax=Symbiodinium pilosum TaxID=2952 RepID=A0A812XUW4_SYMPI|nr:unnamed protein product [Symbiodinium pilosum]